MSPTTPGTRIGRYPVLERLASGPRGTRCTARDPGTGQRLEVVTLAPLSSLAGAERAAALERLRRDVEAASRIAHPAIVAPLDVGEADDGTVYVAYELVEGESLEALAAASEPLPVDVAVEMIAGAAEALDHAHEAGVIHGDLRTASLIRVADAMVRVTGIGLGAAWAAARAAGALGGEAASLAPEQVRGMPIDGRTDQFALGGILYELLAGASPFPGDSDASVVYRIVHEPPRESARLVERAGPAIDRALRRSLEKERDARFASGAELAAALRAGVASRQVVAPETPSRPRSMPPPPPPPSRRARGRGGAYAAGIVLLLAAAAAAAWAFRDRLGIGERPPPPPVWLEASVRTEPPGLEVRLDGIPLDPALDGVVRFRATPPFGTLSAAAGCRTAEHTLGPADAGAEVLLVLDPTELGAAVDPGVAGASVALNGETLGRAPVDVKLDLCRENVVEVRAEGYRPAAATIPAGASPLAARSALAAMSVVPIPRGRLSLPEARVPLVFFVDGKRVDRGTRELELLEGTYELRFRNAAYWIDEAVEVRVDGGALASPEIDVPPLSDLVVQAFPPNCTVELRRPGGAWVMLDETPLSKRIAAGRYEVRVTLKPTGESEVRRVELRGGDNPPVRVSFAKAAS